MNYLHYFTVALMFCTTHAFAATKGNLRGNTYTAPGHAFTLSIPNLSEGVSIPGGIKYKIENESNNDQVSSVSYTDSLGNCVIIENYSIPRDVADILKDQKIAFEDTMSGLFQDAMPNQVKGRKPKVLERTYFLDETLGHAFFGVYSVPDSAGMFCKEKNSIVDSKHAYLFTLSRNYITIVRMTRSPVGDAAYDIIRKHSKSAIAGKDPMEELKDNLLKVRRSIQFPG